MRKIIDVQPTTPFVNHSGNPIQRVKVTRIDTEDSLFREEEVVEKDSIFDPSSPNYNPVKDAE